MQEARFILQRFALFRAALRRFLRADAHCNDGAECERFARLIIRIADHLADLYLIAHRIHRGRVRSFEPRLTATRTVPPASSCCPGSGSCVVICPAGTLSLKISS